MFFILKSIHLYITKMYSGCVKTIALSHTHRKQDAYYTLQVTLRTIGNKRQTKSLLQAT